MFRIGPLGGRRAAVLACLLAAAVPAGAAASAFDQGGPDVRAIVEEALERADASPDVPSGETGVQAMSRYDRDCVRFAFEPAGPALSDAVWLRSTEYVRECRWVPDGRGGGREECHERPRRTYREKVQLELRGRKALYPWERESFRVCLEGPWLDVDTLQAAYAYRAADGERSGLIILTPGARTGMDPDPNGITASDLVNAGGSLAFELTDRWASYYAGEATEVHAALYQHIDFWPDALVAEGAFAFPAAASYRVELARLSPRLEPGRKYYVQWGFRRPGSVSKPTLMKRGDTNIVPFLPAPAGAGR